MKGECERCGKRDRLRPADGITVRDAPSARGEPKGPERPWLICAPCQGAIAPTRQPPATYFPEDI